MRPRAIHFLGWVGGMGLVGPALRGLITVRSLCSAQATGHGTPARGLSVPVLIGPVVAPGVGGLFEGVKGEQHAESERGPKWPQGERLGEQHGSRMDGKGQGSPP